MIVGLEGGLCNQAFQLAFGLSVAKARGEECFFTRHRFASDPNGRVYSLAPFAADVKFAEREEEPILWDSWYYNPGVYDPQWKSFCGHWQTEKYFDVPLVREALRLRDSPSLEAMNTVAEILSGGHSCFIHVRRTDTLKPEEIEYRGRQGMDYYQKAIEHVRAQVPDVRFFVFSDDPDWCEGAFPGFTIVRGNPAHEDLWLMSFCNHAIIPNSTFGWFGAWLNPEPNRIVIAPAKWFNVGLNYSDVVPARWLKLEN